MEKARDILAKENIMKTFTNEIEMLDFLEDIDLTDERIEVPVNLTRTEYDEETGSMLVHTPEGTFSCFNLALGSLEQRSGDTAVGHSLMTTKQIMESMNNYWYLNDPKKKMFVHLRGGKVLQLESERYAPMSQEALMDLLTVQISRTYKDREFVRGFYSHEHTEAVYTVSNGIPEFFKRSWEKANLPKEDLKDTKLYFVFSTADLANAAAKVAIYLKVGDEKIFMGDNISVIHKDKEGTLDRFNDELEKLNYTVEDELSHLTKLMSIKIQNPYDACVRALHTAGIPDMAKKAYKEFEQELSWLFSSEESAFSLYSCLFGILSCNYGEKLTEQKRFAISNALHKLATADWKKFDRLGA